MFGKTETEKYDRRLQVFLHCHDGANGAAFTDERRRFTECGAHRIPRGIGVGTFRRSEKWLQERFGNDLHIGILFLDELADKNTEGVITPEELAEYDDYLLVADLVGVMQSQARAG